METYIRERIQQLKIERDRAIAAYGAAIAELEAVLTQADAPATIEQAELAEATHGQRNKERRAA